MISIITRANAKAQNLVHYFTGKVCKNNHISIRLVSTGNCLEGAKQYSSNYALSNTKTRSLSQQKWRSNNPEYIKLWRNNNPEKTKAIRQLCYSKNSANYKASKEKYNNQNRNKILSYHKNHYQNNKSKYFENNAARRAIKLNAFVKWADKKAIAKFYKDRPANYHVDHIIPLRHKLVCGLHNEFNLQYLPAAENLQKLNKFTPLFLPVH